jgi:dynein heavy chain 1
LTETEQSVSQMQGKLHVQEKELDKKRELAKEKLKIMVENQKDAQNKKQESLELSQQLQVQSRNSLEQLKLADEQLSQVQPMLEKAEKDVGSIKPNHLNELRTLGTPPMMVQKTLEAVVTMLECSQDPNKVISLTWNDIKRYMSGGGFIKQILNFDKTKLNKKVTAKIQKKYLSTGELDSKSAYNASQACGPLLDWVISMVHYAEIFDKVAPLKAEAEQLKGQADVIKEKREKMEETIADLEKKISVYTDEYTHLLSETKSIEMEMAQVKAKVERSQSLLKSLSSETVRWREQSNNFSAQMDTVVGDVLWCSAFLTYAGFFDEHYRAVLTREWINTLDEANVSYKVEMSLIEFLSKPDQRLEWEANKLPMDNICVENAIMLSRFNRYPMVIDPTGQATEFLMNQYRNTKISKTSFLDAGFQKSLESALRFGTPLLIQDAENIDPILNPILNKEVRRIGGRNLVRLGNQDIDLSPTFFMVLATRDPTHQFDPDICSRVTFVNFTVTPSSLHTQCLNIILQSERPEIEKLRSEQLNLQGAYKLKLRNLEKSLLDELSEAKGNILENENLISTLERLKANAAEIALKVKQSDEVMEQSRTVSELYHPLAQYCSSIYFTMNQLSDLHFLYHFSLTSFFGIINHILSTTGNIKESNKDRVQRLISNLFHTVYVRTSRSLLHVDQLPFALRLAQIRLLGSPHDIPESEREFFLKSGHITLEPTTDPNKLVLSPSQLQMIDEISRINGLFDIKTSLRNREQDWLRFINEGQVPVFWDDNIGQERDEFRRLIMLKVFRPDLLTFSLPRFVTSVFDANFLKRVELDLGQVVKESDAYTPLLLASMSGYDATSYVEELTTRSKKQLSSIAMGSAEAYEQADKALQNCMKRGEWILLKNVHLSPQYLTQLEKKLHGWKMEQKIDHEFRLFLTSEIHPSLPVNLLRRSSIIVFEPPHGIKSHLSQTFANLNSQSIDKTPMERGRLILLVTWFHSVVQERLRYEPLGWSKHYEFNQSDLKWAIDTVDKWIDLTAHDRTNIQPEHLPWKALHVLLGESIYGGKVDNEFDQQILRSFLEQLLVPNAYDQIFSPAPHVPPIEGTRYANFIKWIDRLDHETPEWAGLPNDVRKLSLTKSAADTVRKLLHIQNVYDSEETLEQEQEHAPSWAKTLRPTLLSWLEMLPKDFDDNLSRLSTSDKNSQIHISSPLYRYFGREIQVAATLVRHIRKDVMELLQVCDGSIKTTNYHRELIETLTKGIVPRTWRAYNFLDTLTVNTYLNDFVKRLDQLSHVRDNAVKTGKFTSSAIWMGGLLFPEAFLTATRQYIAHKYQYALETLELQIRSDEDSFSLKDLQLESAQYEDNKIKPTQRLSSVLPNLQFRWTPREEKVKNDIIKVPVYLNASRKTMLCTLAVEYDRDKISASLLYQRGVAMIAWV